MQNPVRMLRKAWEFLREASGENDYARYAERARKQGGRPMTRQSFYLEQLERKHSRPSRCC
jgi:uncharacterized short protein YbdD (DUF466 family)